MHKSVNARESYPGDTVRHPTKWLWGPCGRGFLNEPEKGGAATPRPCAPSVTRPGLKQADRQPWVKQSRGESRGRDSVRTGGEGTESRRHAPEASGKRGPLDVLTQLHQYPEGGRHRTGQPPVLVGSRGGAESPPRVTHGKPVPRPRRSCSCHLGSASQSVQFHSLRRPET